MSQNNEPLVEKTAGHSEESICPSCGRFVGAYEKCPFCQAELKKRLSVKIIKRISVIGAFLGLVLLWYAARNKQVDKIHLADINENMNNALVKIEGRITGVRIDEEKRTFKLTVDDGTARISLNGFNALKEFRKAFPGDLFPGEGDQIEVIGQLNISQSWGASVFLKNPRRLKIIHKYVTLEKNIKDLTKDDVGQVYKFNVEISDIREFSAGRSITIKDSTGEMDVTVFTSQYEAIKDTAVKENLMRPGAKFILSCVVDDYRGTIQLKLKDPDNPSYTKLLKEGTAASSVEITEEDTSAPVRVGVKKEVKRKIDEELIIAEDEEPVKKKSAGKKKSKKVEPVDQDMIITEE